MCYLREGRQSMRYQTEGSKCAIRVKAVSVLSQGGKAVSVLGREIINVLSEWRKAVSVLSEGTKAVRVLAIWWREGSECAISDGRQCVCHRGRVGTWRQAKVDRIYIHPPVFWCNPWTNPHAVNCCPQPRSVGRCWSFSWPHSSGSGDPALMSPLTAWWNPPWAKTAQNKTETTH